MNYRYYIINYKWDLQKVIFISFKDHIKIFNVYANKER